MTEKYSEKLKDPRWQKKRLEIFNRDQWMCQRCYNHESTLVVHHRLYLPDTEPWDYPNELLLTLCESCHELEREERSGSEELLLQALRKNYLIDEIVTFRKAFENMKLLHTPEVIASVYEWVLTDEKIQRELIDRYFKMLEIKAKEKNA